MNGRRVTMAAGDSGPARIPRSGLVAAAIIAAMGFGTFGCAQKGPGTAKNPDELLTQLKDDRAQIDQTNNDRR